MSVVSQHSRADTAGRNRVGSLHLHSGFCSPVGSVLSLLFPISLLVTRLLGRGAFFAQPSLPTALFFCCPHCLLPLVLGLAAPQCFCCADLLLLSLCCQALAPSPGCRLPLGAQQPSLALGCPVKGVQVAAHSLSCRLRGRPVHGRVLGGRGQVPSPAALCSPRLEEGDCWRVRQALLLSGFPSSLQALSQCSDPALHSEYLPWLAGPSLYFWSPVILSPPGLDWGKWGCPDGYPAPSSAPLNRFVLPSAAAQP